MAELSARERIVKKDQDLVRSLLAIEHGLLAWEVEFVDAIGQRMRENGRAGKGLSLAQRQRALQMLCNWERQHGTNPFTAVRNEENDGA